MILHWTLTIDCFGKNTDEIDNSITYELQKVFKGECSVLIFFIMDENDALSE